MYANEFKKKSMAPGKCRETEANGGTGVARVKGRRKKLRDLQAKIRSPPGQR